MVKCAFCGRDESFHKGIHLIKNDGSVNYFCSGRCRKNAIKLGRDNKRVRWANAFHIKRQKTAERVEIEKAEKNK